MLDTVNQQAAPTVGRHDVTRMVVADLVARAAGGEAKYGTRLMTFNGRDPEVDEYQELLDAVLYRRQRLTERYARHEAYHQDFNELGLA